MTAAALDTIDDVARGVAAAALAGQMDERTARGRLAELVLESQVALVVSRYQANVSVQQRTDLAENLLNLLVSRVLDEDSTFDLERIVAGSLCGWARQLAVRATPWDEAVRPRGAGSRNALVAPVEPDFGQTKAGRSETDRSTYRFHSAMAFEGLSAEDLVLSDWSDPVHASEALERVTHLTGFTREPQIDRARAAALREVLALPALCIPVDPTERDLVLELVRADGSLARRSLIQMASMVCTEPPSWPLPGEEPVGELLLSLWDDFDPGDLESLMVRPAKAAHLIVVDAMAPLPKPSREAVRSLTREVRSASIAKDWVAAQDGLVVAFLATCTQAVSSFDDTNDAAAKAAKQSAAATSAGRWPGLAARVAAFPGAPLGATPELVSARLRDLMVAARGLDADVRIASRTRRGLGLAGLDADAA